MDASGAVVDLAAQEGGGLPVAALVRGVDDRACQYGTKPTKLGSSSSPMFWVLP